MKLTPGTCGLCAVSDQVIVPFGHTKVGVFLPETLKSYIGVRTIEEISSDLQVCSFCIAHMLQVVQYEESLGKFSTLTHRCSICRSVEHLVNITEWSHFDVLLENINAKRRNKCAVCLPCIAYLERLNVVIGHFLKRVSKLQNSRSPTTKPQITRNKLPRSKRAPKNEWKLHNGPNVDLKPKTRSKQTKAGLALNHLKPLKYSDFNVDEYKNDRRLLDQIAFVSLKSALTSVKESTQVKKTRKNQKRAETIDISKNPVSTPSQFPFKIMLKSSNTLAKKSRNKQAELNPTTSEPKHVLKEHQQDPKTKQLIVRILKTNLEEFIHTAQHDDNKANLSTEGDVEINSKNIDETQELFTDDLEENTPGSSLNGANSSKTLKRKRLSSNQTTPEESNSEIKSDELNLLSLKRLKIDAIDQAKNDAFGPFEPVDPFDALRSSVVVSENKESEDALFLEITLANLERNHEEDNSSSCSAQTEVFTNYNQVKDHESKEIRRLSTLDSDIEITESKIESSTDDTIVTLAELGDSVGVTEDGSHIDNSQLIEENSATHEKNLTDVTEKPLETEDALQDVENVEADNSEKHTKNVEYEDDDDDDCLPDNLHLHLDIEPTKYDNNTCTPANEGSGSVL